MKKQISFTILTLIFILVITGCGHKSASKPSGKSETELVSSSISSEISLSEKQGESGSLGNDNYSDESVTDETTSAYSDSTSSFTDLSPSVTTGSIETESTFSSNTPSETHGTTSSYSNTTIYTPQDTKSHTNGTTTQTEQKTTYSATVPATTSAQPTTTAIPQTTTGHIEKNTINVTISISCKAALNNPELKDGITLPSDGIILNSINVKINKGDTVYDAFRKACTDSGIKFEYTGTVSRKSIYIISVSGLSEMDCGKYSGWKYSVNGIESSLGCSMYTLSDGDIIDWHYTTTL